MRYKSSKVNEFRLWGLLMTMGGMLLMILGLAGVVFDWGTIGRVIAVTCMIIGMLAMLVSMGIYFWAGMLSTSSTVIECPECGKVTKILGKTDRCMYCKTILTLDPKQEKNVVHAQNASQTDTSIHKAEADHKSH
ncbi:DUF2614 family zinc ribbon-containing protein [Paenibacillus eucommiae]|uniref:Membrane-bound ClpP family serine protease n=1 Tax=Paenibacillus eucommiae TaxID=1355755 RepID=A0ABS4ITU3_9BACL|nr:DUF2614 family zinc ribbon-containing protein [Paenibacillus eucommiae]MBP1990928.1 membrane-bound ClpP family serine protease [Paenibacillus eucommiae]